MVVSLQRWASNSRRIKGNNWPAWLPLAFVGFSLVRRASSSWRAPTVLPWLPLGADGHQHARGGRDATLIIPSPPRNTPRSKPSTAAHVGLKAKKKLGRGTKINKTNTSKRSARRASSHARRQVWERRPRGPGQSLYLGWLTDGRRRTTRSACPQTPEARSGREGYSPGNSLRRASCFRLLRLLPIPSLRPSPSPG
ncbi:hypothetical protein B0T11DRAFT_58676 [Plectosphaerella cucumerina]|uniref:Uncharacterized protein n=1 Tax=Plectosphaerella cucumerina TaxID=40658 RepID=A0A8K0X5I8_9PEZI|nr:hypothetical protein B0T11DRAFT_58676 [Plectosphaerella cucumerina]